MLDFETYLAHSLDSVSDCIVKDAMQYSLMAGGKRIRPRLLLATLQAYGKNPLDGYGTAAAIEMIHTYSLIHDDLPAMDNDTLRRGRPTCHVKFGESSAILAGDALLTQAFTIAINTIDDAQVASQIIRALSEYSGANGMILGQVKDLTGESNPNIDIDGLKDIHLYKTGKLLTLPFLCGAYLAHANESDCLIWEKIGQKIGLSFQIQDDILDVTSTSEKLGKNINSDIENNKTTYVSLMGIEAAQKEADRYYEEAKALLKTLPIDPIACTALLDELIQRKK
ncbi:MAG: polyprenyl synthetase family protein [Longicatena sp.]